MTDGAAPADVLSSKAIRKRDRLAAIMLFLSTVGTFAWGATSLGFYFDDSGFLARPS
jgi:hypothetical protein